MNKLKIKLIAFLFVLGITNVQAQAPSNDDCSGAQNLPISNSSVCTNSIQGTTINATQSLAVAGCSGFADDDVWYKFKVTNDVHIIEVNSSNTGGIDFPEIEFSIGSSCGTLNYLDCSPGNNPTTNIKELFGLTIGDTVYFRVYSNANTIGQGAFTVCVKPELNDGCGIAYNIEIDTTGNCTNAVIGTTVGATQSSAGCQGNSDDDVWYKFTATNTTLVFEVTPTIVGGIVNPIVQLLTGNCPSLNTIHCSNSNRFIKTGLTIGETIYLRIFSSAFGAGQGQFRLCVSTFNDECTDAKNIAVSTNGSCNNAGFGNTIGGTSSMSGCTGFADDDIWYKFKVTNTTHIINVNATSTGGIVNPIVELFTGTCGTLTSLVCKQGISTTNNFIQTGLTIGDTIFLRVYSGGFFTGEGKFSICILEFNDECSNATQAVVNLANNCNVVTNGTTIGATESMPGCSGTADDDVWYKFVATNTTQIVEVNATATNGIQYPEIQLFTGNCSTLTSLSCSDGWPNATTNSIAQNGLIIGDTVYVRIYSHYNAFGNGAFSLCIKPPPPPPTNDDSTAAVMLTVNADVNCTVTTTGTTLSATQTMPACYGTADDDVWYKFVATAASHRLYVQAVSAGIQYPVIELFSSNPTGLTSILCSNFQPQSSAQIEPFGLTIGNTYYVRVHSQANNAGQGNFTICINTPVQNDHCYTAAAIPVSSGITCTTTVPGNTLYATMDLAGCVGTNTNDVWYTFVATSTAHKIIVNATPTGGIGYPVTQLFEGNCTSLTSLACGYVSSSPLYNTFTTNWLSYYNLTVGSTYYVRVYSHYGINFRGAFDICITTPVANDECTGAITLPVSSSVSCTTPTTGTNINATKSFNACAGNINNLPVSDVWYKFIATATTHRITVTSNGIESPIIQLFSGSCASLTSLACMNVPINNNSSYLQTDLTIGATYYVRVYNLEVAYQQGQFTICVTTPPAPTNDNCSGAIPLTVNNDNSCTNSFSATTYNATSSQAGCIGDADDDVWFSFVATNAKHQITVTPPMPNEGLVNPVIQIFSGTCGSLISIACSNTNNYQLNGLIIGTTYYIRVYSFEKWWRDGNFTICINTPPLPPANDNCNTASSILVNNNTSCTNTYIGTTKGATQSNSTVGTCETGVPADDDVWYSFTVPESGGYRIEIIPTDTGGIITPSAQLLVGNCSSLSHIDCGGGEYGAFIKPATGLSTGNTYFLKIFSTANNSGQGAFKICIKRVYPHLLDDCFNANTSTALPINNDNSCTSFTFENNTYSLQSQVECSGDPRYVTDVWFRFIATTTAHQVSVYSDKWYGGSAKLPRFQVFSGDCNNLNSIYCSILPNESTSLVNVASLNNLTIGSTYYIRVYNSLYYNDPDGFLQILQGHFKICINKPPADNCINALDLTIKNKPDSSLLFSNTNTATQSMPPTCTVAGLAQANDVWYKFIAVADTTIISVNTLDNDLIMELFSGTCNNLTSILCQNDNILKIGGLNVGNTYFLRLFSISATPVVYGITAYKQPIMNQNNMLNTNCLYTSIVINGSFEDYTTCPTAISQFPSVGLTGWNQPNTATTDYYNSCSKFYQGSDVPYNYVGSQNPRSGKGFAGIVTTDGYANGWREYIQGQFNAPMVIGKTYLISFFVNSANISNLNIDKLGVYFSNNLTSVNHPNNLTVTPQIITPAGVYFNDYNNWVNVTATFTATQAYQYFIIGNFNTSVSYDAATNNLDNISTGNYMYKKLFGGLGYLFIDDVSISEIKTNPVTGQLCSLAPLPLTLLNFSGNHNNGINHLSWQTASEVNTQNFEVMYSTDGITFATVGFVNANGSGNNNYSFKHIATAGYPIGYYRLKMVDRDGQYKYSNIIKLALENNIGEITVFPNPVNDVVTISNLKDKGILTLYSLDGKQITTQQVQMQTTTLNMGKLSSGTYLLQYVTKNETKSVKIIKR